jgi:capsular polysaccharide transport system permease protein
VIPVPTASPGISGDRVLRPRSSLAVTRSVWKALLVRESLARLFGVRGAWFWLLLEPLYHVAYVVVLFMTARVRHVGGIDTPLWVMIGMLVFLAFRRTGTQASNAVNANQALFTYRQVRPVDAVLMRALLEGILMVFVSIILGFGAWLAGFDVSPSDPLLMLAALLGLWLLGLGYGLVLSVAIELVPEIGRVVGLIMTPLYFASGTIFPIASVPPPYREALMLNPIAHGLEAARQGFSSGYHAVPELNLGYLYGFAVVLAFLGLVLHRRFAINLVTK